MRHHAPPRRWICGPWARRCPSSIVVPERPAPVGRSPSSRMPPAGPVPRWPHGSARELRPELARSCDGTRSIDPPIPRGGWTGLARHDRAVRAIVRASDERAFDAEMARDLEQAGIPPFVKPLDLDRLLAAIVPL